MRRGLMEWDPQELPVDVLEARIARSRGGMKSAGLDAFIIYTNLVRPSAVTHLTGFTPYWSEGLLLVPMTGRLVFATALSNRVADWIRSTNPVSEVTSTPRPGTLLGERLAKDTAVKRVGILELDAMPSELSDHLAVAAPAVEWIDGSALFATLRRGIDATEHRMLARADAIAVAALDQVKEEAAAADAGALAGLVEQHARLAGAEETYIAIAPDLAADRKFNRISKPMPLSDRFAVRASVAYKGCWVRRTQTFAAGDAIRRANVWFDNVVRKIDAEESFAEQLAFQVRALSGATLESWMVESCVGSYPLSVVASSRLSSSETPIAGSFYVLTAELLLDGQRWIGSAPLIVGKPSL
jgi:hypothetical protein